MKQTEE